MASSQLVLDGKMNPTANPQITHSHISNTQEQTGSRLLQLPAELRNIIYEYALNHHTLKFTRGLAKLQTELPSHPFGLIRVCRQVHAETSLLFYSSNEFYFSCISDVVVFSDKCTSAQLGAIARLGLRASKGRFPLRGIYGESSMNFSFLADFSGVQVIRVFDICYSWRDGMAYARQYEEAAAEMRRWLPGVVILVQHAYNNEFTTTKY